jgi:di/tricarboxylate transporter
MLSLAAGLVSVSAFLLNTALVAMAMPVVLDWCRKRNISPSRLLIPVSYFSILGGVCTLIGTSTTLVVDGELRREHTTRQTTAASELRQEDHQRPPLKNRRWKATEFNEQLRPMELFEIGKAGLPCTLAGSLALLLLGRHLLPKRSDMVEQLGEKRREYLVEMEVRPECRLIGQTVQTAGLRQLPGLFLIEIDRDGDVITPVTPSDVIRTGDRLIFTGVVHTILDLERIPGLIPAADTTYEFNPTARQQRHLTEVVLSRTSPLIGTTLRHANFRQHYNAAVVAVHRNGVRLTNKIGNIVLEPADTLLLQTRNEFVTTYRNSRDFYLVSSVEGDEPRRHDRALLAGVLAVLLVGWLAITSFLGKDFVNADWAQSPWVAVWQGVSAPEVIAIATAVLMILTRCLRVSDARASIDYQILFIIVGALGLGKALESSGVAHTLAEGVVALVGADHPWLLLVMLYLITMLLTELITNNAVAAMLFPLAVALAWQGDYNPRPFVMAVALAASLSFITPIGYQTNLMVMGPGGYRPMDYFRAGLPVTIVVTLTALFFIPKMWPF